jgi:NRAMP (natural resistance-associated macrophage protein)-like metal ion transporter
MTSTLPSPDDRTTVKSGLQILGPGLITGASDDDPSGIATYSQAGAQFGYALGWTLLATYPLMAAIQEISARLGRVTGKGLAGNIKALAPGWLLHSIVGLLVVANTVNAGADLAAMGAATQLLVGGPAIVYAIGFAAASFAAQVLVGYARYASLLKWLTLSLLAYVATVFAVPTPWGSVLRGLVLPEIHFSPEYFTTVVAILGTTISPYLFFWQASEEVEEEKKEHAAPLKRDPGGAPAELTRIRLDTYLGMGLSNLVALFIVTTAAATLHTQGKTDIQSAADAAQALRPIAGDFAFAVFAMGIIGTGLLALPVLAGATAYAVGEARGWTVGLNKPWRKARPFYGTIGVVMAAGLALNAVPIDPIKALFWSAVLNGVIAVPIMAFIMVLASSRAVMGQLVLPAGLKVVGWIATAAMLAAALVMMIFGWN